MGKPRAVRPRTIRQRDHPRRPAHLVVGATEPTSAWPPDSRHPSALSTARAATATTCTSSRHRRRSCRRASENPPTGPESAAAFRGPLSLWIVRTKPPDSNSKRFSGRAIVQGMIRHHNLWSLPKALEGAASSPSKKSSRLASCCSARQPLVLLAASLLCLLRVFVAGLKPATKRPYSLCGILIVPPPMNSRMTVSPGMIS